MQSCSCYNGTPVAVSPTFAQDRMVACGSTSQLGDANLAVVQYPVGSFSDR